MCIDHHRAGFGKIVKMLLEVFFIEVKILFKRLPILTNQQETMISKDLHDFIPLLFHQRKIHLNSVVSGVYNVLAKFGERKLVTPMRTEIMYVHAYEFDCYCMIFFKNANAAGFSSTRLARVSSQKMNFPFPNGSVAAAR